MGIAETERQFVCNSYVKQIMSLFQFLLSIWPIQAKKNCSGTPDRQHTIECEVFVLMINYPQWTSSAWKFPFLERVSAPMHLFHSEYMPESNQVKCFDGIFSASD